MLRRTINVELPTRLVSRAERDLGPAFREAAVSLGLQEFTTPMLIAALAVEGMVALRRVVNGEDVPRGKRVRACVECFAATYVGTGPERLARREAIFHKIRVAFLGEREH